MKLRASALSDIGRLRSQNEDFLLCEESLGLFGVADGIGGLPGGAQASRCAIETLREWFGVRRKDANPDYSAAIAAANTAVFRLGREISPRHGIGSTLTLGHLADDRLVVLHVGDSWAFRLREGELTALTREHNVENELRARAARGEETPVVENGAALTRCVGQPPPLVGDVLHHQVAAGDRYLFCTDGITRYVDREEISAQLSLADEPAAVARELINLANERGGLDNSTAVVVFLA
jgi:protein phosphatase